MHIITHDGLNLALHMKSSHDKLGVMDINIILILFTHWVLDSICNPRTIDSTLKVPPGLYTRPSFF